MDLGDAWTRGCGARGRAESLRCGTISMRTWGVINKHPNITQFLNVICKIQFSVTVVSRKVFYVKKPTKDTNKLLFYNSISLRASSSHSRNENQRYVHFWTTVFLK